MFFLHKHLPLMSSLLSAAKQDLQYFLSFDLQDSQFPVHWSAQLTLLEETTLNCQSVVIVREDPETHLSAKKTWKLYDLPMVNPYFFAI